jgi:hypothetical protein
MAKPSYYQVRNARSLSEFGVTYGVLRGLLSKGGDENRNAIRAALRATHNRELVRDLLEAQLDAKESQDNDPYYQVAGEYGGDYDIAFRVAPELFWYHTTR